MDKLKLELYWNDIPTEKAFAVTYTTLTAKWSCSERSVRFILQELSHFDNGDNYILIRSGQIKGFYKTDDIEEIKRYKNECMKKRQKLFYAS